MRRDDAADPAEQPAEAAAAQGVLLLLLPRGSHGGKGGQLWGLLPCPAFGGEGTAAAAAVGVLVVVVAVLVGEGAMRADFPSIHPSIDIHGHPWTPLQAILSILLLLPHPACPISFHSLQGPAATPPVGEATGAGDDRRDDWRAKDGLIEALQRCVLPTPSPQKPLATAAAVTTGCSPLCWFLLCVTTGSCPCPCSRWQSSRCPSPSWWQRDLPSSVGTALPPLCPSAPRAAPRPWSPGSSV